MAKINSSAKGKTAERELCKLLGEAFDGSFIRSANSGAFIGGSNAFRKETLSEGQIRGVKGDIIPPDFMPNFAIESKHYKDFAYHQLLVGPVPMLDAWVDQHHEVLDENDFWLVAFKTNRKPWIAVIEARFADELISTNKLFYTTASGIKCVVCSLDDFLKHNRALVLRETAAKE